MSALGLILSSKTKEWLFFGYSDLVLTTSFVEELQLCLEATLTVIPAVIWALGPTVLSKDFPLLSQLH